MKIEIAELAGYCFGVKRALAIAEETLVQKKGKNIYTVGQIIHNPQVVKELDDQGIHSVESADQIPEKSIVIIRSHGLPPSTTNMLEKKNISTVDATCPFVKTAHKKIRELESEGYFVVLVGTSNHPEVIGIAEQIDQTSVLIAEKPEDLANLPPSRKKIGVIVQTTQTLECLKAIVVPLLEKARELKIINTICNTTKRRQHETRKLASTVDLMLVIGGKNSANTTHLAQLAREVNPHTYHIQSYKEIEEKWLKGVGKVGLSGGASTPRSHILEVKNFLEAL